MAGARTRFAPSPTGSLHIGNVRTALFNYLFAKHTSGAFILRIEDTDTQRSKKEFESSMLDDLRWLGLDWDEGPDKGGPKGPYRQSERLGIYRTHAETLLSKGLAYHCYCTKERLEELRSSQIKAGQPPRYDGRCRGLKNAPADIKPSIRFNVQPKKIEFADGVHGHASFDASAFGDFVIIGSDGIASYNFAVVIDDALMEITHIIRGEDHLSNTPRQILLFESLGFQAPSYSHIPLVLSPDRIPLSKRDPSSSVRELRENGYLPEAVTNAVARLGWAPGEDLASLDELAGAFKMGALSKSPSVFDIDRLNAYNKAAISRLGTLRLCSLISDYLKDVVVDHEEAVDAVRANAERLTDFEDLLSPFNAEPPSSKEAVEILKEDYAKKVVSAFLAELKRAETIDGAAYKVMIEAVKIATGEKGKRLFLPIRAALTGRTEGIELVSVLKVLGKERSIQRLEKAI